MAHAHLLNGFSLYSFSLHFFFCLFGVLLLLWLMEWCLHRRQRKAYPHEINDLSGFWICSDQNIHTKGQLASIWTRRATTQHDENINAAHRILLLEESKVLAVHSCPASSATIITIVPFAIVLPFDQLLHEQIIAQYFFVHFNPQIGQTFH